MLETFVSVRWRKKKKNVVHIALKQYAQRQNTKYCRAAFQQAQNQNGATCLKTFPCLARRVAKRVIIASV